MVEFSSEGIEQFLDMKIQLSMGILAEMPKGKEFIMNTGVLSVDSSKLSKFSQIRRDI